VLEHPLPVLDFAAAEPPIVRAVQAGRMAFEAVLLLPFQEQRKAYDHEDDRIRMV
jgi:hypothetical protein